MSSRLPSLRSSVPVILGLCVLVLTGCAESASSPSASTIAPARGTDARAAGPPIPSASGRWVDRQLQEMTLDEKIAQLFIIRLDGYFQNASAPSYRETEFLVDEFGAGGILFGPGTPMTQVTMANELQQEAERPLLISQDTEWGVGMRIDAATTFPQAMALGATRTPSLAYRVGFATAREARALGVHQIYAPVADVNNNPNNPIINVRSFGEEPGLVGSMASAFARGAQDGGTLATVKHFPGHGDTDVDSHISIPILRFDRARLDSLELVPFREVLDAGVASVMTGHLALPALAQDEELPASLSPTVTTDLLRKDLNFDNLVVTDALNMAAIRRTYGVGKTAVRVLESGADLILMSDDPRAAHHAVRTAVDTGRIEMSEINDSVRRLLRVKEQLGLHEQRTVPLDTTRHRVARRSHKVLSREVARQSLTLLSNDGQLLPITPPHKKRALVVKLSDSESPGVGTSFVRALRDVPAIRRVDVRRIDPRSDERDVEEHLEVASAYDVVVVPSFLRVRAWSGSIGFEDLHETFLNGVIEDGPPVILAAFGNPYAPSTLDTQPEVVLAAYGSGTASQAAAAQALAGAAGTPGTLPVTVPNLADAGNGIPLPPVAPRVGYPESRGMNGTQLADVDSVLRSAMRDHAFPGAATAVGRTNVVTKLDGHGYLTYDQKHPVDADTRYDIASLTKVVATTTAAMLLVEENRLDLDATVARYLPEFAVNDKGSVTVRQLLNHSSGLKPYLGPEERGSSREAILDTIMAAPLAYEPGTKSEYSGLGMITLMRIVESITGQPFDTYCEENIFEPLGMYDTAFHDVGTARDDVAPTTDTADTHFQGTVHDPIARAMGGVSGNAGLFSTAPDLARFAYMLAHDGRIYGRQFLEKSTIDTFTRRADVPGSTRALGWDTKSVDGYSSAGKHFSTQSFGHTGYTGTSLWIDPETDLYVILLSNRVYPDDTSEQIQEVRPKVADEVYESMVGPPEPLLPGSPPS